MDNNKTRNSRLLVGFLLFEKYLRKNNGIFLDNWQERAEGTMRLQAGTLVSIEDKGVEMAEGKGWMCGCSRAPLRGRSLRSRSPSAGRRWVEPLIYGSNLLPPLV